MAAPDTKMATTGGCNFDPGSGFCNETRIFHSLRPNTPMPASSRPLSITQYALSLLQTTPTAANLPTTPYLINSATGNSLSYSQFLSQTHSLCLSLQRHFSLNKNDVAYIIVPPSFSVPVLYLSLLSLGITICPANPLGSSSEVAHQLQLTKPKIAFATSQTARNIPHLPLGTVLIDSPDFLSWLAQPHNVPLNPVAVNQTDSAAILFSSGTTGKVKGVILTHSNLIASISRLYHTMLEPDPNIPLPHPVSLFPIPLFHGMGFFSLMKAISNGESVVLMERFDFVEMLKAVEKYKVTFITGAPPLIMEFVTSDLTKKFDLGSRLMIASGGAPLWKEVTEKFKEKFPNVQILQIYGLTETGGVSMTVGPEEMQHYASVGRLNPNMEAKIVDPETGEALPPGRKGELWLRGPTIMKGYVGDAKATAETLDSEGWCKTGDLCYFDAKGFLYIIDRLKALIKYKGYQVPPADLEPLLQSNPEIADAAVIPYPDEEAGQIPMAYVVRKPGSNISEAQIIDYIAKQVAPYKKIRRVVFTNAIPKSPAGKIFRLELVNHALSGASSKL